MMGEAVANIAVGALLGGIISGLITWWYAKRGAEQLRSEANRLRQETEEARHYVNALISYLGDAGAIRVERDENGRPIQITLLSGTISSGGSMSGELSVGREDPPPDTPSESAQNGDDRRNAS